jgi:radical SAM superfamily enzyme YgiQ (UPF0313 family)
VIVFGGPHPTVAYHDCLANQADICVIGEGEKSIINLVEAVINKDSYRFIKGIAYLDERERVVLNESESLIGDLSTLPYPDYSILNIDDYTTTIHTHSNNRAFPIIGSRGCVNSCPFCSSKTIWKQKVRYRDTKDVISEIVYFQKNYGIIEYHFYDDDFLLNKNFCSSLASELIDKAIKISYCCISSIKSFMEMSEETLRLLIDSGLKMIELGFESFDENSLRYLEKTYSLATVNPCIQKIKSLKIDIYPLLMFLVPCESLSGHIKQSDLFIHLFSSLNYISSEWKIDQLSFMKYAAAYTPYPGTRFWDERHERGLVLTDDFQYYNTENIVFIPNELLTEIANKVSSSINDEICSEVMAIIQNRLVLDKSLSPKIIYDVWNKTNGNDTISEIAKQLHSMKYCSLSLKLLSAICVIATIVFVLMGCAIPVPLEQKGGKI